MRLMARTAPATGSRAEEQQEQREEEQEEQEEQEGEPPSSCGHEL